jgi:hypothetical protein
MSGYTVAAAGGVTLPNATGGSTSYPQGSVVPLSKLLPSYYQWMVQSGLLSENYSQLGSLISSGPVTISDTTDASSSITGSLIVSGGVGIAKKLYVGTSLSVAGTNTFSDTTDSSSTSTGSAVFSGGVGIAKKLYVGTDINATGNITATGVVKDKSPIFVERVGALNFTYNTEAPLSFGQLTYNPGGCYDSGTYYYTCPTSGLYRVTGKAESNSLNVTGTLSLRDGGGAALAFGTLGNFVSVSVAQFDVMLYLASGTQIRPTVLHTVGPAGTTKPFTGNFMVARVG